MSETSSLEDQIAFWEEKGFGLIEFRAGTARHYHATYIPPAKWRAVVHSIPQPTLQAIGWGETLSLALANAVAELQSQIIRVSTFAPSPRKVLTLDDLGI